ncbi:MAG: hypothetical protein ACJ79K_17480 [Gemmatimonadaceae bacterium]
MTSTHLVAALALVACAASARAQTISADSVAAGTPIRVELRRRGVDPSMLGAPARPERGQSGGVVNGAYDSWSGAGITVTDRRSKVTWTFPSDQVVGVQARTGTDHRRVALVRASVAGAIVAVGASYLYHVNHYHTAFGTPFTDYRANLLDAAAIGVVAGGAYRYARPAGRWSGVTPPTIDSGRTK